MRERNRCRRGSGTLSWGVARAPVSLMAFLLALPGATGCTTHQCDADCVVIGAAPDAKQCPGENTLVPGEAWVDGNDIVWESSPTAGPWLDFPGQRTYEFKWRAAFESVLASSPMTLRAKTPGCLYPLAPRGPVLDRTCLQAFVDQLPYPYETHAWVATGEADKPDGTFVEAAGQLAYMNYGGNDQLNVFNATCADYSLRVVVRVFLGPPETADAGAAE